MNEWMLVRFMDEHVYGNTRVKHLIAYWDCQQNFINLATSSEIQLKNSSSRWYNKRNIHLAYLHLGFMTQCVYYAPPLGGGIKRWCCLTFDLCLTTSVAYIGPKSRTERPRKTKIGTCRGSPRHMWLGTTFKVKRSKVKVTGREHIVAASRTACFIWFSLCNTG